MRDVRGVRRRAEEDVGDERRALDAGDLPRALEQRRLECRARLRRAGTSRPATRTASSADGRGGTRGPRAADA